MRRRIITTSDGSKTIHIEDWNEQYHSKHGAIQEAYHVFIKQGLNFFSDNLPNNIEELSILEIGFGTGLNAFITALESTRLNLKINYTGVEAYPVEAKEYSALNYAEKISEHHKDLFNKLHTEPWEDKHQLTPNFNLVKRQQFFSDISDKNTFDLIYFDAFGARLQPELWTEAIFSKMYKALKPRGVLVTYSAKGSVKRAMQTIGFTVERLEGPPGKRHMLRAIK